MVAAYAQLDAADHIALQLQCKVYGMTVATVDSEMHLVRDLVNDGVLFGNREKLGFVWDMVCASMDMVGDAQLAIDSFGGRPTNDGQGYLEIYGLFQAFFLQQDALANLVAGLNLDKIDEFDTHFRSIRELRNKYFGHPSKRDRPAPTTYHGLSRMTVGRGEITAWTYPNFSVETIDIAATIKQQARGALSTLEDLYQRLTEKRKKYVMTFDGQTLPTDRRGYEFEKLGVWAVDPNGDRAALARISLGVIHEELAKIKEGIEARYDDASEPGDVMRMIQKARFCADHLSDAMARRIDNEFENEIYVDALRQTHDELIELCAAINKDFAIDGG